MKTKNLAREILEDFASSYSLADVDRLAAMLDEREKAARKETAREFFELSEECGGGVAFWKRARALAKRYGVEVDG